MNGILANILRGTARPAVQRPVPLVPQANRSQAVETLELRVRAALPLRELEPGTGVVTMNPGDEPFPGPRSLLMPVGRIRQAEDSRLAQLERELVMERMRVRELREQLAALMEGRAV